MDRPSLSVSPVAELLIGLAERRESGTLALGERTLQITLGELQHVSAAEGDCELPEFLVRSGRLTPEQRARVEEWAAAEGLGFEHVLGLAKLVPAAELRAQRRALWLDRFARSLRRSLLQPTAAAVWTSAGPTQSGAPHDRARLVPMLLDALSRIALDSDAAEIGRRLNHRLLWRETPLEAEAKRWASFGETIDRPSIAALLARLPACAPQIAALVRAGFVNVAAPSAPELPPDAYLVTLPPPPPRLSNLPVLTWSPPPSAAAVRSQPPRAAGPRVQLDPGSAGNAIDDIPVVEPTSWPKRQSPLHDPLRDAELALLESRDASHRAELYVALAELWETRIGSLEEAARNLREAAAADPRDVLVLAQTARTCFKVGHGELALRYAATAVAASEAGAQRAEQARLLAELYETLGQPQQAIATLSEAAAEHASAAWPHESIAQLLFEADRLQLAAAHLRCAGAVERVRNPQHALVLYALAYGWDSENPGLATEYADALDALGHPEAAIAILAQTARTLASPKRRTLQLQAAERADSHQRADLAAEILLEMASELSEENPLWPRIDRYLDRPGLEAERAAVLENFAQASEPETRVRWLTRAAAALARVGSEAATSLRYLWLAAQCDGSQLTAAELGQLEAADPATLRGFEAPRHEQCAVLEAQLKQSSDVDQQRRLLAQLSALRAERADAKGVVSACLRLLSMNSERGSDSGFDAIDLMAVARLWRTTALLPDPVLRSEALSWQARVRTGQSQGRALALLARELEGMHDFAGALASAESALTQDASAADAALIALRHIHRHKPERALPLLVQAQRLLAAPPAVLFASADCAAAAGVPELQLRALTELGRKLPFLAAPHLFMLDVWLRTREPLHIASAAEDLLDHARGPHVVRRARDAVSRLAELGKPAAAARLAERVLAVQGKLDPSYADHAYALAQASEDPGLAIAALERAASAHSAGARAACLFQLATRHAAVADRAAEQRALLRAAAVPAGRTRALEQLALRFAECGDLQRLLTVLSLQLDATGEAPLRRRLLFDMACAAVGLAHDQDAAAAFMRSYLQEAGDDRDALLFGLGGLFALGDDAWAYRTARAIADALPDAVAGVIYLWLAHKAELAPDTHTIALELACEGARRFPAVGELLLMAERLTLSRKDAATALALYDELIVSCTGAHGTRALHYRAGRWLEKSGAVSEALPHYQRAFELAPGAGVAFAAIERCARASERWDVLVDTQSSLAEHTPDEGRRVALLDAAITTSLRQLHDPLRTLEILLEAENGSGLARFDEQLFESARAIDAGSGPAADFLAQIARVRTSRIEQIWDPGAKATALIGLARLHTRARRDDVAAAVVFASVLETELAEELALELRRSAEAEYAALRPVRKRPAADSGKHAASSEEALRARAAGSGSDALTALEDLTLRVCAAPGREVEAHALLAQLVRTAPERTDALRELQARAVRADAAAEARICAQIAALFARGPTAALAPLELAPPRGDELWRLIAPDRDPALVRLTQLIWTQARSLPQLHPASHLEALGAPFSATEPSAVGRAFAHVTKALARRETKLFIKVNLAPEVSALPGPPSVIVVRAGFEERAALEFQMARAIVSCEPEHALVTALSERDARRFLRSVQAAFGPDEPDAALTRFDRALAQQLSAAVPRSAANELRELLRTHAVWLDYAALKAEAERSGARAGLFVSGDVTAALQTLARTQPALGDCDIADETGFQRACRQSVAFAEVVRTALSAAFVALTERALSGN